jgi:hypothetical protein
MPFIELPAAFKNTLLEPVFINPIVAIALLITPKLVNVAFDALTLTGVALTPDTITLLLIVVLTAALIARSEQSELITVLLTTQVAALANDETNAIDVNISGNK